MKNTKLLAVLAFLIAGGPSLFSQTIKAYFNYCTFYIPGKGPYVETYLSIVGNSVKFTKNDLKKFQASVEINIMLKQKEEIITGNKYNLFSPEINDTNDLKPNFIDIQRFAVPDGQYDMVLIIKDKNNNSPAFQHAETLSITYPNDSVRISDIQFIESYKKSETQNILSKSGYDLIPYVSDYFPENMNKFTFYVEIYNSKKILGMDERFLVNYSIESYENGIGMSDFYRYQKQTSNEVNVLLSSFDITSLPSGNYYLKIEVKDKVNTLVASKKIFFQRRAPLVEYKLDDISSINTQNTFVAKINNADSLYEYIQSVRPISSESEKKFAENQLKSKDINTMKQYLYSFWIKRNPNYPETAFINYNKEVAKVNKHFSTQIKKGYETDRGRVYLQYGAPNTRNELTNEPNSYPYEIWHYYKAKDQTNRRFVFYNTDLVSNDYQLLYSDARGEPSDPNWRLRLKKRTMQAFDVDQQDGGRSFGNNADDFFINPR